MLNEIIKNALAEFVFVVKANGNDPEYRELAQKMESRKVILTPKTLYATKLIGGASSTKIIDPSGNDNRQLGRTNIDNAKLKKDEYFMPVAILLRYVTAATGTLTEDELSSSVYKSFIDIAALANGEYNFRFGNMIIAENEPMTGLALPFGGDDLNKYGSLLPLPSRRIARAQQEILFEVMAPRGTTYPAETGLRLDLFGIGTTNN